MRALVLVCSKCGKKNDCPRVNGKNASKAIRKALKKELKTEGKKNAQALMTSCLKLCPRGKVAVALVRLDLGTYRVVAVDPVDEGGSAVTTTKLLRT